MERRQQPERERRHGRDRQAMPSSGTSTPTSLARGRRFSPKTIRNTPCASTVASHLIAARRLPPRIPRRSRRRQRQGRRTRRGSAAPVASGWHRARAESPARDAEPSLGRAGDSRRWRTRSGARRSPRRRRSAGRSRPPACRLPLTSGRWIEHAILQAPDCEARGHERRSGRRPWRTNRRANGVGFVGGRGQGRSVTNAGRSIAPGRSPPRWVRRQSACRSRWASRSFPGFQAARRPR